MRISKLLLCMLAAFSVMFLVGCGSSSPKAVTEKFYSAVLKGDWKTANNYCTEETVKTLTPFQEKLQKTVSENGKVKALKETIDGDTAVVVIEMANKKGETSEQKLVKVNGKWKIDIKMGW